MTHETLYHFFRDTIRGDRLLVRMAVISVACHLVLLTGIIFTPKLRPRMNFMPTAVKVDLVTLSALQPPLAKHHIPQKTAQKHEVRSKKRTKPSAGNAVALTKRPVRIKESLKRKTYTPKKVVETAIEQLEKELPQSGSRQVVEAINRLKEQVAAQAVGVKGASGKTESLKLIDIYNAEIWYRIQKQWAFSNQLAQGKTNLEAIIIAKIMKNGQIRDIWFEERSGNTFFDDSVLRAIKKSDPLPSLPEGYPRPYYEVGFRFNLSELQQR